MAVSVSASKATHWPDPLYRLTLAVAGATQPQDIFEAALDCVQAGLGVERSSLLLFDDAGVMRFVASRGLSDGYRAAVEGHSPWTPDTTDASPLLVPNVEDDPSLDALRSTIEGEGIRALAFIPLTLGPKLIGKFMLYYADPHVFTELEVLSAQAIAAHVSFAIDQHHHHTQERELRERLEEEITVARVVQTQLTSLMEASSALMATHQDRGAVETILRKEAQLLGANAYAMWAHAPESDDWSIVLSEGLSPSYVAASATRDPNRRQGLIEPMVIEDVRAHARLAHLQARYEKEGIRSIFVSPIKTAPEQDGALTFYYQEPHAFTDLEIRVGLAMANLASAALTSSWLLDETHQAIVSLEAANAELAKTTEALREANDVKVAVLNEVVAREREFHVLADCLPAIVFRGLPDGAINYRNDRWFEYTGLPKEDDDAGEIIGALHPDELDEVVARWNDALRTGQDYSVEFRLRCQDGSYRWHLGRVVPIKSPSGDIVSWATASVDIDDQKKEEERARFLADAAKALASSLDFESTLTEVTRLAVPAIADLCSVDMLQDDGSLRRVALTCADPELQILFDAMPANFSPDAQSNHPARRILRSGRAEVLPAVDDADLKDVARDDKHLELLRRLQPRSAVMAPLIAHQRKIGTVLFASFQSGRTFGKQDLLLAEELSAHAALVIENARLYRDAKELAEDLERANHAKDEFLGLVSHELRTPLTTIQGNASVLERDPDRITTPDGRQALADIVSDSQRLENIIENLLLVARAEAGLEAEREPLLVTRVVRKIVDRHKARHSSRPFEVRERDRPRPVNVPRVYLEQVLENLISNAEKYSPETQPITIDIERTDREVRVRVLDRGAGVSAEDLDHLFDPFYRSATQRGRAAGLGIGLSVCKRLVEAQDGRIWAGTRDGGGSEFGFALPLLEEDAQDA